MNSISKYINNTTNNYFSFSIIAYIVIMLIGIALRTYITHTITIVWIINLLGLLLFFPYLRHLDVVILRNSLLYIALGIVTILINLKYLHSDAKSIGTNVNIIIFPLFCLLINYVKRHISYSLDIIAPILKFISYCGFIVVLFTWLVSFKQFISVFRGLGVYKADVSGFFYSKNIYGAFIGLSLFPDLYFFNIDRKSKSILFIVIKALGVVLSFSRAALLQVAVFLFIFIWKQKRRTLRSYILLLVSISVIITILCIALQNNNLIEFVKNSVLRVNSGDAGRNYYNNRALMIMNSEWYSYIFGVGFAGLTELKIDVDNTYLYLIFTGGVVKLLIYIGIFILTFKRIAKMKSYDKKMSDLCLAMFVSYLIFAFFESVAILELGLLNFLYMLFVLIIPSLNQNDNNMISLAQQTN